MTELSLDDLAIEHELARVAGSFRFILDVTPLNVEEQRAAFLNRRIAEPAFRYRELEDDPAVIQASLEGLDVDRVENTTCCAPSTTSSGSSSPCCVHAKRTDSGS